MGELKIYLRLTADLANRFLAVKDHLGVKNDTEAIRSLISWYWREHRAELERPLEHFNLDENGVLIRDPDLDPPRGRIIEVYFKPDGPECEYCESKRCRHIDFALSLPEVQKILREKGWKPS